MNTKVSQSVAALLALGATAAAHAVDLSTVSTSNILFISGSTSIDNGIIQRFVNTTDGLCGSSIDTYADTNAGVQFVAVACLSGSHAIAFGIASNTPIAFIKEDNAGSLNGITPVNNNTAIAYPNVTTLNTANCGTTSPHTCNNFVTVTNRAPNFGYSDVNAELFGATTNNLNVTSSVDTVFGIGVSLGFYHALQRLEGLVPDDNVTHVPSIFKSHLYTMLQGTLPPSILLDATGTDNAGAGTQLFGTNTNANSFCGNSTKACATSDPNNLYLCLRGQSSGAQQAAQVYFGNIGCTSNVAPFSAPSRPTCAASGCRWTSAVNQNDVAFAGASTGDVLSCLQAHDSAGHLAMGIVSTSNFWGLNQANSARRDWRFIKIDGVMPSIENVSADRYEYWAQSLSYAPRAGRGNVATGVAGSLALAAAQIGAVTTVTNMNSAFQSTNQPAFDGGFIVIPDSRFNTPNTATASLQTFRNNPVNSENRGAPPQTNTNNCQSPSLDNVAPNATENPVSAVP